MADPPNPNTSADSSLSNPPLTPTAPIAEDSFGDGRSGAYPTPQLYPNLDPYLGENPNWQPSQPGNPLTANQGIGKAYPDLTAVQDDSSGSSQSGIKFPKPQADPANSDVQSQALASTEHDQSIVIWEELSIDCHGWQMLGGNLCKEVEEAYEDYLSNPDKTTATLQQRAFDFKNFELVDVFGCVYPIRRVEYPGDSALAHNIVWLWNDSDEGKAPDWKPYSSEIVNLLEKRFLEKKLVVDLETELPHLELCYAVGFHKMVQINMKTKNQRRIRRDVLDEPFPKVKSNQARKM